MCKTILLTNHAKQ